MSEATEAMERRKTDAVKDRQTVTPEGVRTEPRIAGVVVRPAVTHVDERGELCEIYNPAWGIHESPMVYAYQSMIRPGKVKGWVVHHLQDDRLFVSLGTFRFVLYDARAGSPTQGAINEIFLSERNRAMIIIPRGVYHALQNVGKTDAYFINLPTRAYDHSDPDKYRLPLDTDLIPYRFAEELGH
jgi:dTDP-4-dehydrorhamnose 3,5-epimerase